MRAILFLANRRPT